MERPPDASNEKTLPAMELPSVSRTETAELNRRVLAPERVLQPTGPSECAILVAENEGMPTRPDAAPVAPVAAGAVRQTGTLRLMRAKSGKDANRRPEL